MSLKSSSFARTSQPGRKPTFSSPRTPSKLSNANPSAAFKPPRSATFERSESVGIPHAIVLDSIEEEQTGLDLLSESDSPAIKSLKQASDDIDDCSSTVEDSEESEEPQLTEGEFREIVSEFAEQYGIKVAQALFEKAVEHLKPIKKRKIEK